MAKRRKKGYRPLTDEDVERIAEAINNLDVGDNIQDEDSFIEAYEDYFEGDDFAQKDAQMRDKTFNKFESQFPSKISRIPKKKKEVVRVKPIRKKRVFRKVGRVRRKVVYVSEEFVTVKKKKVIRHRDKLGRFASVKRKIK